MTTMVEKAEMQGVAITQERILRTPVPGPRSQAAGR